jgi:hypothetical protein
MADFGVSGFEHFGSVCRESAKVSLSVSQPDNQGGIS